MVTIHRIHWLYKKRRDNMGLWDINKQSGSNSISIESQQHDFNITMNSLQCLLLGVGGTSTSPRLPNYSINKPRIEIKVVVSSPRNGGLTKEVNLVSSSHGMECRRQEDL